MTDLERDMRRAVLALARDHIGYWPGESSEWWMHGTGEIREGDSVRSASERALASLEEWAERTP